MVQLLFQLSLAGDVPDVALNVLVPVLEVAAEISGDGDTENAAVFLAEAGLEVAHTPGDLQLAQITLAIGGIAMKMGSGAGTEILEAVSQKLQERRIGLLVERRGDVESIGSKGTLFDERTMNLLGADELEPGFAPSRSVNGRHETEIVAAMDEGNKIKLDRK
jgi:hypothetical protein